MLLEIVRVEYFLNLEEIVRVALYHTGKNVVAIKDTEIFIVLEIQNGNDEDISMLANVGIKTVKIGKYGRS